MALRRRRRLEKAGLPESVGALLLVLALACTALWWRSSGQAEWRPTAGRVIACQLLPSQYRAQDVPYSVELTYEYTIGGRRFIGHWRGVWPQFISPNALPSGRLAQRLTTGYPLVVLYDPTDLARSALHGGPIWSRRTLGVAAAGAVILLGVYGLRIYPSWRTRRPQRFVRA